MTAPTDQTTIFAYTNYIQGAPERVWQGLTDPALMRRYWRHQKAGGKTFRSDWKKGSTYDMAHEEVGLVAGSSPVAPCSKVSLRAGPPFFRVSRPSWRRV
jgi:hypothetical protein